MLLPARQLGEGVFAFLVLSSVGNFGKWWGRKRDGDVDALKF